MKSGILISKAQKKRVLIANFFLQNMWPLVIGVMRRYSPYTTLPFAAIVGFIGYNIEGWISDKYTPTTAPVVQQRQERLLENLDLNATKRKHNPLEVNLSPSLSP